MKNIKVGIQLNGKISSEVGFKDGYEVFLAYRDIKTGEFELISRKKIHETGLGTGYDNLGNEIIEFNIFGENVVIYGEGRDIVFVYNGKYKKLDFSEKDLIGKTIIKEQDFRDSGKTSGELFEDDYIVNSKIEATNIYYDPFIQSYINEERFSTNFELSGLSEIEYKEFVNKFGAEKAIGLFNKREKLIQKYEEEGKTKKEIFNKVFDNLGLYEVFEKEGYSKNEIEYIRDNGMNGSIKLIESKSIPENIQRIYEKIKIYEKVDVDKIIKGEQKQKEQKNEITKEENNNEKEKINNGEQILIKKEENIIQTMKDQYGMYIITTILIFLIVLLIIIQKKLKKEKKEDINIILSEED